MIKIVRHIMNKMDKNIKVVFQTNLEEDVITWENHVNEIIDSVESRGKAVFKVYMKNLMPIKEMDNSVRELWILLILVLILFRNIIEITNVLLLVIQKC